MTGTDPWNRAGWSNSLAPILFWISVTVSWSCLVTNGLAFEGLNGARVCRGGHDDECDDGDGRPASCSQ